MVWPKIDRIAEAPTFQSGLQRVIQGSQQFRLALMCAEKDPLECHRALLVSRHLAYAANLQHIRADGSLESHDEAETRLMAEERVPDDDFFLPREQLLARAYSKRGEKTAYRETAEPVPPA